MLKPFVLLSFLAFCLAVLVTPSQASTEEVLYVSGPQGSSDVMLYTYGVDPMTAAATHLGNAINVASGSIIPLSIGTSHYLYVWNTSGVWLYQTRADGVPLDAPSQHLVFSFPHPVITFLVDPDGKFAYAALGWGDNEGSAKKKPVF
jgi:hypothetical protein